jgi:hypothetical protein
MHLSRPTGVAAASRRSVPGTRWGAAGLALAAWACLAAQPAFGADTLSWKFKPGETLRYTMEQNTTQGMKAMGQEFKTKLTQTVDLHWSVKSVSSDGVADLGQTIDRVRTKVEGPGTTFEFDSQSDKAPEGPIAPVLAPLLKALVNAEFTFKMNPKGELSDVKIPPKLIDSLKNAGPAAVGGGMFSEEGLKNLISQSSLSLPGGVIDPGKTWNSKARLPLPMIGTMIMDKNYTYDGPGSGGLSKISLNTKVTLEPAADSNVAVKITSQDGKGEFSFDPEAGRVQSSQINDKLQLSLSIQGQTLEQTTDTVTTMKLGK